MSTEDASAGPATAVRPRLDWREERLPARANPVPAWLRFFISELRLVFGRPRNLALLGVLAIVPVFLGILLRLTIGTSGGPGGPPFLNQLAGNGVFLALVVLSSSPLVTSTGSAERLSPNAGSLGKAMS